MRVLFTANPLLGHWLPMLPLARAALAAGHEVVVAAGPDVVPDLERRGFLAWSIGPTVETIHTNVGQRPREPAETEAERQVADGLAMFADPAVDRARDVQRLTARWQPDIVVQELYELGGSFVPAPLHVFHGLGTHYPGFVGLVDLALTRISATLGPPAWLTPITETVYVDPFPAELQPPEDQPFLEVMPIRPAAGEVGADDALPESVLRLSGPTVYLSFGTLFGSVDVFADALAALQALPVDVVLTCGLRVDPAAFGPLPGRVVVERYVPQALLLPRCSAVVCHAGAGTLIGALAHGLPLVCLPQGADQFGNAQQVARVGAGITLSPGQSTPEAIRAAVDAVLTDPSYASAARSLQAQIAQLPEPTAVMTALVARANGRDAS